MDDDHPGVAAIRATIEGGSYVRTAGQLSDAAAVLRGLERFNVDIDTDQAEWAEQNTPMTSYSMYGFDDGGNWSCVFVNKYSGKEPLTVRPWRHAVDDGPDPAEAPHDPDQIIREYVHGFHLVSDVDRRISDGLAHQAANVPWSSDDIGKGEAATVGETKMYLEARFGD